MLITPSLVNVLLYRPGGIKILPNISQLGDRLSHIKARAIFGRWTTALNLDSFRPS
jgi:hypothetical protein